MAVLEIPELELQLKQDTAGIEGAGQQVSHAEHEVDRLQAVHRVAHLQADRLNGVAKTRPGLVAQQEIDDARGKDLALEAQMEAGRSTLQTVKSELEEAKAKLQHDRAIFDYARITAPLRV
jgi:multidrug resistance efflux pump